MKTRRILSTILAIVLVVSTFTFGSFTVSAAQTEVYVSDNGSDTGAGTLGSPYRTIAKAFEEVSDGGTVFVVGPVYNYTGTVSGSMHPFPSTNKKITIEGYGTGSNRANVQMVFASADPQMFSEITFKYLDLVIRGNNGAFFTNGYKTSFGGGMEAKYNIYLGNLAQTTASEHFVFTDGINYRGRITLGNSVSTITNGSFVIEANSGSTAREIYLVQADWGPNPQRIGTVKGDLRVKVDATSTIESFVNDQQKTTFEGSYMQILEEGATVPTPDEAFLSAFKNNGIAGTGYYKVLVKNPQGGSVDFGQESGKVNITVNNGYIAMVERGGETFYTGSVDGMPANFGGTTTITFTNAKQPVGALNLVINPATPGESVFPVAKEGAGANGVTVSVEAVSPNDAVVDYSKKYTYTVKIQANSSYVFTQDFEFDINGKDRYVSGVFDDSQQYRITDYSMDYSAITFKYKLGATNANVDAQGKPNEYTLEYNGGIGSAVAAGKSVPDIDGYGIINKNEPEADWKTAPVTVIAGDVFTKIGYDFVSYYYVDDETGAEVLVPAGSQLELTQNTKLYVKWQEIKSFAVNFQNGGATGTVPTITGKFPGEVVVLPQCEFSLVGHKFAGWKNTYDLNDTTLYQPGDQFVIPQDPDPTNPVSVTYEFTAQWQYKGPSEVGTIYYVSAYGDDANPGTQSEPFATINAAAEQATTSAVTVVVLDNAILTGLDTKTTYPLTIVGKDLSSELKILSTVYFARPTTIENISLNANSGACVYTNGYKSVFGPNLPNNSPFRLDIADGAEGTVIAGVDTTINSGVEIGNYNFGGKYVSGVRSYISGESNVTFNNGAKFNKIDISPINASGRRKSVFVKGNVTFNINADFGEFAVSDNIENLVYDPSEMIYSKLILLFNNGTIPASIPSTLASDENVYIVDSGVGNTGSIKNLDGHAYFYCNTGSYLYATSTDIAYRTSTGPSFRLTDYVVSDGVYATNKVRFGTPIDAASINATFASQPTAGVKISAVAAPTVDYANCDVRFDSENAWTPAIEGGFFDYNTKYTANLVIYPKSGYFFNDFNPVPAITVNTTVVNAKLNPDGTVSVSYEFPTSTSYEAPEVTVTFKSLGQTVAHTFPETPVHLGTIVLPSVPANKPFTQYFGGWEYNGEFYPPSGQFKITDDVDRIEFTAKWITYCSINLPTVLLLYDYSSQGADLGRNPEFSATDSPILAEGALANLEHPINGSTVIARKTFDREKAAYIESDGSDTQMWVNETTLSTHKIKAGEYKYMTIVYYYKSRSGAAVGKSGKMTFGSCILPDGTRSKWFNQAVTSKDKVVSNKWATMTFDLTKAIEKSGVDDEATFAQFHIWPIGDLPCSKLEGDTLYMKALYFSKEPPVTAEAEE